MNKHKHIWKLLGYTFYDLQFKCKCGEVRNRHTTPAETKAIKDDIKHHQQQMNLMFKTLWNWKKKFTDEHGSYPIAGHALAVKAWKWAKNRKDVQIVKVEDYMATGSIIVLIDHSTPEIYHGCTAIFIPQHGEPAEIGLYPHHSQTLLKALQVIVNNSKKRRPSKHESFNFTLKAK